ncbi:MAG: 30S ribosome-binding factor RbfA [Hyphomonadaceae bacterium]
MKPPTQRQLRAGELIRHALMDILSREEFSDPDLQGKSITITEVRISPDLKNATAFSAPLGGEDMSKTVAALNRAAGFLRGRLSREIDMRFTPILRFIADDSYDEARRIDQLLQSERVRRDLDRKIGD